MHICCINIMYKVLKFQLDASILIYYFYSALWKKYAAIVLENGKVRLEVHNLRQRLLMQLKDRHVMFLDDFYLDFALIYVVMM